MLQKQAHFNISKLQAYKNIFYEIHDTCNYAASVQLAAFCSAEHSTLRRWAKNRWSAKNRQPPPKKTWNYMMSLTTPSPLSNVVFMLAPSPTSNVVGFTKLSQWRWQSNFGLGGGADRLPTTLAKVEGAQVVFNVACFIMPVLFRPVLSKFQVFFFVGWLDDT